MITTLTLGERAYRFMTRYLPVDWAVRLDWAKPAYRESWGGPMNGQRRRCDLVRQIFEMVAFRQVVETGSFRGTTTRFLSLQTQGPVESVEVEERFYKFAVRRCADRPNVRLLHGDSRSLLRDLSIRSNEATTFFYLDAHWQEDVPRHEELRIIHSRWADAVVMIDDFEVPGDAGYGVAMYGGKPLTSAYLPALPGWVAYYPAIPSAEETGARRGCIVLASGNNRAALDDVSLLRKAPGALRDDDAPPFLGVNPTPDHHPATERSH